MPSKNARNKFLDKPAKTFGMKLFDVEKLVAHIFFKIKKHFTTLMQTSLKIDYFLSVLWKKRVDQKESFNDFLNRYFLNLKSDLVDKFSLYSSKLCVVVEKFH